MAGVPCTASSSLFKYQSQSFDASYSKRPSIQEGNKRSSRYLKRSYQSLEQTDVIQLQQLHKQYLKEQQQQQKRRSKKKKSRFILGGDDENNGDENVAVEIHSDNQDNDDDDEDDDETGNLGGKNRIGGWRGIRAVVAYYCSLRKIKRNGAIFDKLLVCLRRY